MRIYRLLQNFFIKREAVWETFMVILAIVFVVFLFMPDFTQLSFKTTEYLDMINLGITIFFILEFVTRFSVSVSKKRYLKQHWLDILAILPVIRWLRLFSVIRILWLWRLAPLIRLVNTFSHMEIDFIKFVKSNGLWGMILALTTGMAATSVVLYFFEYSSNNVINNYWDALYAAIVTWMTPGYGDIFPVTTGGRVCGLILIVSGLITWGILIATLAGFLAKQEIKKELELPLQEMHDKISVFDDLNREELVSFRGAFNALIDDRIHTLEKKDTGIEET